jgi:hypothetical protein
VYKQEDVNYDAEVEKALEFKFKQEDFEQTDRDLVAVVVVVKNFTSKNQI